MSVLTDLALSPAQLLSSQFLLTLGNNKQQVYRFTSENVLQHVQLETSDSSDEILLYAPAMNLEKVFRAVSFLQSKVNVAGFRCAIKDRLGVAIHVVLGAVFDGLQSELNQLANSEHMEVMVMSKLPDFHRSGLLVVDMDSTVIQIECIDEIANYGGVGAEVSEVTELAMQGKLDFADSLKQRVSCLKGVPEKVLEQVRNEIPLMPGLVSLIEALQKRQWKIAIASGGFHYFAHYLKERLQLDHAKANTLEIEQGVLTGNVIGEIVDAKSKAQCVKELSSLYQIPMEQTVAMGDGANDLLMMQEAALGVAYRAKPIVQSQADIAIRFGGLDRFMLLFD
jgi:phosphoserine phosphatase